jgi:hypothetical protein
VGHGPLLEPAGHPEPGEPGESGKPGKPLALEREERVGVDAALFEGKLGPLSRASRVCSAPDRGSPSRAMQLHGYDLARHRSGPMVSLATRYAGLYTSYETKPLLK